MKTEFTYVPEGLTYSKLLPARFYQIVSAGDYDPSPTHWQVGDLGGQHIG